MTTPQITPTTQNDHAAIEALYPRAFPDEDLLPLIRSLLGRPDVLSLAARPDAGGGKDRPSIPPGGDGAPGSSPAKAAHITGHVVFTRAGTPDAPDALALLGPLCVAPEHQRRGIGGALIRAGLDRLRADGVRVVLVLGDPGYYGRHGFRADAAIAPPYTLPDEWAGAWQSLTLGPDVPPGPIILPDPWLDPALWLP